MQEDRAEYRRKMREKREREAKRQRRNVLLGLIAAVVVLVLCAGVIFGQDKLPDLNTQTPTAAASNAATQPTKKDVPEKTVIHIAAAGDLNITDRVVEAGGPSLDFTNLFLDVASVFSSADYALVNFEGNVYGEPYGSENASAPASILTALRRAGVDMVQLANSCSIKNGLLGLSSTLDAVEAAGLEGVGTFRSTKEFKKSGGYTLVDIEGVKVAFVAFTKGMDGMGLPAGSEDCVNLLYTDYATTYRSVNTAGIEEVMGNVRSQSPDMTIALVHWGSEYNDQISSSQKRIESLLKENGADVIIGTHSHYVQQMKKNEDDGTLTVFSLGDFAGDGTRAGTNYSIILDLEITKDNRTGKVELSNYSFTPVCMFQGDAETRILRLSNALRAFDSQYIDCGTPEQYEDLKYASERVIERINGIE